MKYFPTIDEALRELHLQGFESEFTAEPMGLYDALLDLRFGPDEFNVIDFMRFRETGKSEKDRLLFLISASPDVKGTLVLDLREVYEEEMSFEMALKLRTHPYGEWICS